MAKLSKGEIKVQVNILMPLTWKEKLDNIARETSVSRKSNISYQDIIRETLDKKFKLSKQSE